MVTLGQNEGFFDSENNVVWAQIPPKDIIESNKERFDCQIFSYEKLKEYMFDAFDLLFKYNPKVKIILSVSPVGAYATFKDSEVISNSFASKCLLRCIAEKITKKFPEQVFYYPSFEMVLAYNPNSFVFDNRHVKRKIVKRIFKALDKGLLKIPLF